MSDFISRLAARAVGAVPSARPRLPSLFEAGAGAQAEMEIVDREVTASPAGRESATATGTVPAHETPGHADASTSPARGANDAAGGMSTVRGYEPLAGAAGPTGHDVGHQPPSATSAAGPQSALAPVVALAHLTRVVDDGARFHADAPDGRPAETPTLPPPGTVPAELVHRAVPMPVAERLSAATPAVEPPVRVHIGRLEVRAVLPDPPPLPPRRGRPELEGLSLADYLRGRRDAR